MVQKTLMPVSTLPKSDLSDYSATTTVETTLDVDTAIDIDLEEPNAEWRYDAERINRKYRRRPFQVLFRVINIFFCFATYAIGLWWDKVRGTSAKNERARAIQLRSVLTKLGPAYIKVGQALSTRPDLVSPIYLEELAKLQDQLPSSKILSANSSVIAIRLERTRLTLFCIQLASDRMI